MVGFFFIYNFTFFYFVFILTVTYLFKFIMTKFYQTKIYFYLYTNFVSFLVNIKSESQHFFSTQIILLVTLKLLPNTIDIQSQFLYIFLLLFLCMSKFIIYLSDKELSSYRELQNIKSISMLLFCSLVLFSFINNLLLLIFSLELIGVIYYFFFLTNIISSKISFIKYKNLISNYLWNSFIILLFLSLTVFFIAIQVGTLDFKEVQYFSDSLIVYSFSLVLIIIFWKVGAPGFHFFKLELYQYLPIYSLLLFSLCTLFVNYYILGFILFNFYSFLQVNSNLFLCYLLIFNIILLYTGNSQTSLFKFLALSSVNTWGVVFIFSLVIDTTFI